MYVVDSIHGEPKSFLNQNSTLKAFQMRAIFFLLPVGLIANAVSAHGTDASFQLGLDNGVGKTPPLQLEHVENFAPMTRANTTFAMRQRSKKSCMP